MGMFGTKTAVSALCLAVFGFIGAGAEPLAFPEALGFGAQGWSWRQRLSRDEPER